MTRAGSILIVALVLMMATGSLVLVHARLAMPSAQAAVDAPLDVAQGGGPGGRMTDADRAKLRQQMLTRLLDQAKLVDKERIAAKAALSSKEAAQQTLSQEMVKLRNVTGKDNLSEKDAKSALTAYRAAMDKHRKAVAAADKTLVGKLSLKSQARCLALGILDNELGGPGGMRGGMRPPGGRPGGPPPR